MRRSGGKVGLLLTAVLGAVLLVLVVMQIVLPGIAASRISSRLDRYGSVQRVSVKAWPAVKLLWGSADSVRVKAKRLTVSTAQAAKLLWEARGADSLRLTAGAVQIGVLRLDDATVRKHGSALAGEASVSEADVKAALPEGFDLRLVSSRAGQVQVRVGGGLFGISASVDAVALASEGKLIAHPLGFLLEGVQLTLFSEPHVYVERVGASVAAEWPLSYRLTVRASLR